MVSFFGYGGFVWLAGFFWVFLGSGGCILGVSVCVLVFGLFVLVFFLMCEQKYIK